MKSTFIFLTTFYFLLSTFYFADAATYKCDTPEEKRVCTELLNQTEAEISKLNSELSGLRTTGASIERDKQILALQVKQAQLAIKSKELSIANLGKNIIAKTNTINTLQGQIDTGKRSLAQLIRQTNQIEDYSLPEVVLGSEGLSQAFSDLDSFDSIKLAMGEKFTELRDLQRVNLEAKVSLAKEQDKERDAKSDIEAQKKKVQVAEAEKQRLLNLNKTEQNSYQKVIADKSAEAAKIKAALFKLAGGSAAIPFGTAYEYAKSASAKTGVRPAFLLAILTQESNLGSNVGQCYLTDQATGSGIRVSSGAVLSRVMKPTRDVAPFIKITESLGFDWKTTRVSCPLSVGYGGAMGPAQFIPSTWVLFKDRVASALGVSSANPWNPPDAFMASAMYLGDLGGVNGSYSAEMRAACKYYGSGGASCTYGKQVMAKVANIQADIDVIAGN